MVFSVTPTATRTLLLFWLYIFSFISGVIANTEIQNFKVPISYHASSYVPEGWPVLQYTYPEIEWSIVAPSTRGTVPPCPDLKDLSACPNDLWVVLDLGHKAWLSGTDFTIRLSWAASDPVDFAIEVIDNIVIPRPKGPIPPPPSTFTTSSLSRRLKLARIRALNAAVPTPKASYTLGFPPFPTSEPLISPLAHFEHPQSQGELWVPFILILEPLYFGFLPASMVWVVVTIMVLVAASVWMAPKVFMKLQGYAAKVRMEYRERAKRERESVKQD